MSLITNDLKDLIITDLATITVGDGAAGALTTLGTTITSYITANAEVSFSWSGIDPGLGTPDPTIVASGRLSGISLPLTASNATNQAGGLAQLSAEIIAGVSLGAYNITDSGFSTVPLLLALAPAIGTLTFNINATTQEAAMTQLAQSIVTYITNLIPTAPVLGTHGIYTAPAGTGGIVLAIT